MFKPNKAKIISFFALFLSLSFFITPAFAVHPEEKSELENLKKRIEALEGRKSSPSVDDQSEADFGRISQYITLHGVIEAESSYVKADGAEQESDLSLATAELSFEATLNENAGGHLTLLYEEGEEIDVDEVVISLNALGQVAEASSSLHIGLMYLPFGTFNSYMISDPLTLELGETQNTAALYALEGERWAFKTALFNGEVDTDENRIDNWMVAVEVEAMEGLTIGASYISDLAESGNELVEDSSLYSSSVSGASAFLSAECGQFGVEAEYLSALEDFDASLIGADTDLTGKRPEAWNIELAWMPTEQLQVATRYEQATDFQDDVQRYGATASYGLYEHVVVALEYLRSDFDTDADDKVDAVTAQLALEF